MIAVSHFESNNKECGIPIRSWLTTFFSIFGIRSFIQLIKIQFLQHFFSQRGVFDMIRLTFIDSFIIGWLIYGNHLFISMTNDCGVKNDTKFLYFLMMAVLAIGYFTISVYFAILGTMAFDKIFKRNVSIQNKNDSKMKILLASLSRI